ncbi:MAG: RecQ family ATP-dependent DNA helicase [Defluviitaleaceae bacterium]|nr:RecQ family ATP-dependent DNA helicase [Defluviitaleaceae bacterium]
MTARDVLRRTFGYDNFREGQGELIDAVLAGRDVCGIMPTGAGKSLCYQVPALLLPGVTLVVSPLISLMRDQVMALVSAGVSATFINSSLTDAQVAKAMANAREGKYKIIYIAPERLSTASMMSLAAALDISMVAVDEAHCISQWGQDFRPQYMDIPAFIGGLKRRPVVGAFTATATPRVRADILRALELRNPLDVVTGFDRPNLYFAVHSPKNKYAALAAYVQSHNHVGIVYCATRKEVDSVAEQLVADGYNVAAYHAGLPDATRTRAQDDFLHDRVQIIVATNAFGMGIDKSNVRFVIHYSLPQNVEAYYQEAGRAGRDGLPSDCILFYARRDIFTSVFLINQSDSEEEKRRNRLLLDKMIQYCDTQSCLRQYLLAYFGEQRGEDCDDCGNCAPSEALEMMDAANADASPKRKHKARKPREERAERIRSRKERAPRLAFSDPLFESLKAVRMEIATREKVPAFVVFSDATLVDMCQKHPQSEEAFLQVSGVGQVKLERYGAAFLEVLRGTQPANPATESQAETSALTPDQLLQSIAIANDSIQISLVAENINAVLLRHDMKKPAAWL